MREITPKLIRMVRVFMRQGDYVEVRWDSEQSTDENIYYFQGMEGETIYLTHCLTGEEVYIRRSKYRGTDELTMIRRDLFMQEITPKILHISKHYWNEHVEYGYYCEDGVLEKMYDNVFWNYNTKEEVCIDLKKYNVVFENQYAVVLEYGM